MPSRRRSGCVRTARWLWRGMFENIPLPPSWPVYVSQEDAARYAASKGRRLMTEAEFHRAAYGTPSGEERHYPWSAAPDARADRSRGHFDFASLGPGAGRRAARRRERVGRARPGRQRLGVDLHDLRPFAGFEPMVSYPEYSAEFFDGQHYVIKGASPATARELIRPSFRNWFRPNYPYVYAKFRTVAAL